MVKLLKTLLVYKLKQPKPSSNNGGFTLIEVLVGLILSLLVILPLLGFMVNMLQTDRQEQAKASSEQEIQSALSYISRDLEQAVYIYDGSGVDAIKKNLPAPANSVPVLVFWKRQFVPQVIPPSTGISCPQTPSSDPKQKKCDDAFPYALVAYYLQTPDKADCSSSVWSCTAQISRVLYRESVKSGKDPNGKDIIVNQGDQDFVNFGESAQNNNQNFTVTKDLMNAWTSPNLDKNKKLDVLIDYIDQTLLPATPSPCPSNNYQQVPSPSSTNKTYGFYACVDVENTTAQVFMRGNALARLRMKTDPPTYVAAQSSYFPKASIQVKGRGLFSTKQAE